jgi:hypothetical protein
VKGSNNNPKPIAEWLKSGDDVVRVEFSEYRGQDMISVRVWRRRKGRHDQPLNNGINLTVGHIPKLTKALRRAQKKAEKAGLL